jgi:toxin ParE1/3/4
VKPVEWRPRARGDAADAAWWYARQAGLDAGLRFLDAIDVALSRLSLFPASGSARHAHVAPDLGAPLRFVVPAGFERYLIYYLELPDRVLVVRIWNTARGLDALVADDTEPTP